MRSKIVCGWVVAAVIVVAMGLQGVLVGQAEGAWIWGKFTNFEVCNLTREPVNDFELILTRITCEDIVGYYPGWGYPPTCDPLPGGRIRIKWQGDDIPPCLDPPCRPPNHPSCPHFGVRLRPCAPDPCVVSASWTQDSTVVVRLPFAWQVWTGSLACPVEDVILWESCWEPFLDEFPIPPPEFPLRITRRWALSPEVIELQYLMFDETREGLQEVGRDLDWTPLDPEPLSAGGELRLPIQTDIPGGDAAALVIYSVAPLDDAKLTIETTGEDVELAAGVPFLWVISEAELSAEKPDTLYCPVGPSTWGRIKTLLR